MNKKIKSVLVTLSLIALALTFSIAPNIAKAQDAKAIAEAIPTEVAQLLTGGFWKTGDKTGIYRAVVINSTISDKPTVDVFIEWLSISEGAKRPKLVKSLSVKEVQQRNFSNAFVFMEGNEETKMTYIITSFDPEKEEENQLWLKATTPGKYEVVEPQKEE